MKNYDQNSSFWEVEFGPATRTSRALYPFVKNTRFNSPFCANKYDLPRVKLRRTVTDGFVTRASSSKGEAARKAWYSTPAARGKNWTTPRGHRCERTPLFRPRLFRKTEFERQIAIIASTWAHIEEQLHLLLIFKLVFCLCVIVNLYRQETKYIFSILIY